MACSPIFDRKEKTMADMPEIKIGGRTIPLFYSTYEMIAIQRDIGCTAFQMKDEVFGLRQKDEDDPDSMVLDVVTDGEKQEKLGKLIRIMGNAGLEEAGQEPDLTDKWILRHIKPAMILIYSIAVLAVINEGNKMEAPAQEDNGPVDVNVEERNAKKQQGN